MNRCAVRARQEPYLFKSTSEYYSRYWCRPSRGDVSLFLILRVLCHYLALDNESIVQVT